MVSKNQLKLITALQQKKYRQANQMFIAEGVKVIDELLSSNFVLEHLYQTEPIFADVPTSKMSIISAADLKKISALATPNNCLAVFKMPDTKPVQQRGLIIALDNVRDPGNMGTILRLCDWFGVTQLVCSEETVDLYNPKVVQATMGSISRVNVAYVDLAKFLFDATLPVYGTFMDGSDIYNEILSPEGIIVLGNEANGISTKIESTIKNRLTIPRFGELRQTESLNVAMAAAIVLSEFKRR